MNLMLKDIIIKTQHVDFRKKHIRQNKNKHKHTVRECLG